MSLINQVLKDIDKRQGTTPQTSPVDDNIKGATGATSGKRMAFIVGFGLVAIAAALAYSNRSTLSGLFAPTPAPAVVSSPAPAAAPSAPVDQSSASPTASAPSAPSAPASAAVAPPAAAPAIAVAPTPAPAASPAPAPASAPVPAPAPAVVASATPQKAVDRSSLIERPILERAEPAKKAAEERTASIESQTPSLTPKAAGAISKVETPEQRSKSLYQRGQLQIQQNQLGEARQTLGQSLAADPRNQPARLLLARLLIELRSPQEAQNILLRGLELSPGQNEFVMTLAHIKAQGNDVNGAIAILRKNEESARKNAGYQALLAALLQQNKMHAEAAQYYVNALRISPNNAQWLVGLGISLQAQNMALAAVEAYEQALDLGTLPPALAEVAQQRLAQLTRGRK